MVELEGEEVGVFNRRFGVRLDDGARVECVLYRGDTLCVSCQVGCAVGCPFCASGADGFARNLSAEELWGQLAVVRERGHHVARATISGVGEPLHNLGPVLDLIERGRRAGVPASVTTSGGPLGRLVTLLAAPHNGVTFSVHAGTEPVRRAMVPRGPSLEGLFEKLQALLPDISRNRRRKLALAYLVLAGVNDGPEEVDAFVARARRLPFDVHLYAYNPVARSTARAVSRAHYETIYERMSAAGLRVRMSSRARIEQNGGCGTLLALRGRGTGPKPEAHAVAGVDLDART